jgi:hypothetical protein
MGMCAFCVHPSRDLILPGVFLPGDDIFNNKQMLQLLEKLFLKSEGALLKWVVKSGLKMRKIIGKPKTDMEAVKETQDYFIKRVIPNKNYLPTDYKYFGNDNVSESLTLLFKSNPFYPHALRSKKVGGRWQYTIRTQLSQDDEPTYFSKFVDCMTDEYTRVNAVFDENMKLVSTQCYLKGELIQVSEEKAAAYLGLLMVYYNEIIHALIHVFHFLMVTCIADSTWPSPMMYSWAEKYFPNVYLKYEEVKRFLFGVDGSLVGGTFNADRDKVLAVSKEVFCLWGNCKSAKEYVDNFLFAYIDKDARNGILEEFLRHADLLGPYATELSEAFSYLNNGQDLEACNKNIQLYMSHTGEGVSSVSDLSNWVQLMSITGIMHGGTLSFSRFIMTQPIMSVITEDPKYSNIEANFLIGVTGTMTGVLDEKSVFSDDLRPNQLSPMIRQVIVKYAAASTNLKAEYWKKIKALPEFKEHGWILTDYALEGIDGKQFTITTYI